MFRHLSLTLTVVGPILLAGCSSSTSHPDPTRPSGPSPEGKKYLLEQEPAGAKGVIDVRKSAQDGDEVVVAGRIGGSERPFNDGRAQFQLADTSFKACNEIEGDTCEYPWDFCCTPPKELTAGLASVKIVDAGGKTVATDAKTLLGLKELDTVVVKGKVKKEGASFVILATGLHRREGKK